jgi:hypothetical protein
VASPDTFTVSDPALPSQITLAWDDPHNAGQGVRSYYIYYWQAGWDERQKVNAGTQTTYTLQNLEAGQLYSFAVTVHDGAGRRESMLSNEINHRIPATEHTDHRDQPGFTVIEAPGVLANDHGSDGNGLTAQLVSGPSNGSITLRGDGGFTYVPHATFQGSDHFTYQVSDGARLSNVATVTLRVAPHTGEPRADTSSSVMADSRIQHDQWHM